MNLPQCGQQRARRGNASRGAWGGAGARQFLVVAQPRILQQTQPLLDVPLVALDGVEQAGLLGRAWDAMRLWIK